MSSPMVSVTSSNNVKRYCRGGLSIEPVRLPASFRGCRFGISGCVGRHRNRSRSRTCGEAPATRDRRSAPLALDDAPSASAARDPLQAIAEATQDARATGEAQLADARVALAQRRPEAWRLLEEAITSRVPAA